MTDLKSIPMLYKNVPFDGWHAEILSLLQSGQVTQTEAANAFDIPGIGFHRSLWLLSLHCVEHKRYGQQTFVVPKEMQGALSRTSLSEVTMDDLRFPYPATYLALPDYEGEIWGGEDTLWHKVRGVFVWFEKGEREIRLPTEEEVTPENDKGVIHLYIWGAENERSRHPGDDASLWTALDLNEMARESEDLESYLERVLRDPSREKVDFKVNPELANKLGFTFLSQTGERRTKQEDTVIETLRILFNSLLYIDSDEAELDVDPSRVDAKERLDRLRSQLERSKHEGKRKKIRRRIGNLPTDTVTWIGRSVRYDSEPREGTGEGTPQKRHWVRGHWWPKRSTIQRRIVDLGVQHQSVLSEYADLKDTVARAPTPEDTSAHLNRLAFIRAKALKAGSEINDLRVRMETKRRWVMPYKKGSRGEASDSRTYVIGG